MGRHEINRPDSSPARVPPHALAAFAAIALLVAGHGTLVGHQGAEDEEPELRLRATPRIAFAPAEVLVLAELRGGSDDYEQLYCASVEWDWDDGTRSESIPDCDPYEPGVSEIRRRYSMRHAFDRGGKYVVRLNLKKRDTVVSSARTTVEVRGGRPFR